jgi:hypothetical protein
MWKAESLHIWIRPVQSWGLLLKRTRKYSTNRETVKPKILVPRLSIILKRIHDKVRSTLGTKLLWIVIHEIHQR